MSVRALSSEVPMLDILLSVIPRSTGVRRIEGPSITDDSVVPISRPPTKPAPKMNPVTRGVATGDECGNLHL